MRKVIDGKVYDTETADYIAGWENEFSCSDFNWYEEDLYRTKNGRWFLVGNGNAGSRYSRQCGTNTWCGSVKLKALTDEEAKRWIMHKANSVYEDYFAVEEA